MNSALDYEKIAHLYDSYCRFSDDLPFFLQTCRETNGSVLELMCGTGRISIVLLEAGVNLTCEVFGNYDFSPFIPETSPYIIVSSKLS